MSTENVKVFFEKVKKDAGLQKQARELPRVDPEETLKGLCKIATETGVSFSPEDYKTAAKNNLLDETILRDTWAKCLNGQDKDGNPVYAKQGDSRCLDGYEQKCEWDKWLKMARWVYKGTC